ncbi:hypothetical protein PQU92_10415 [Asticcacaulis sp. BYS171W]|uniref:Uncharacterized protein n=1 Tax=Asticcacaulis aquaticus TaxID=2984212 RepID=A0ABT5HUR7_9CAUL|nr:hypothetical protein [Asticcacaulis aquaticus]MDC7683693.1 hypothetical protein [Asticcacaulis aquaticus]
MRFLIVMVLSLVAGVAAAQPKLPTPRDGEGIVVMEVEQPDRFSKDAVRAYLLKDKNAAKYQADPALLEKKTQKEWEQLNAPDYHVVPGRLDAASSQYLPHGFPRIYRDEATGRKWWVVSVPAGKTVIYAVTVQSLWQVRFDRDTAQFDVPAGGYVYVGKLNILPNYMRMMDAVKEGEISARTGSPIALCGEKIKDYTPPSDLPQGLAEAQAFIDAKLAKSGPKATLTAATVTRGPYTAKPTSNITIVTYACMATAQ